MKMFTYETAARSVGADGRPRVRRDTKQNQLEISIPPKATRHKSPRSFFSVDPVTRRVSATLPRVDVLEKLVENVRGNDSSNELGAFVAECATSLRGRLRAGMKSALFREASIAPGYTPGTCLLGALPRTPGKTTEREAK